MKLVLDTNVLVSGVFFKGPPFRILEAWKNGKARLFVSPEILERYDEVGDRLHARYPAVDIAPALTLVLLNATIVNAPPLPDPVCTDPDDDMFLACAMAARCKMIVSGDKHLLSVSGYRDIQVLRPREFVDVHL